MKTAKTKTMLLLILAVAVTFTTGLWFYSTREPLGMLEYTVAGLVLIIVLISLWVGLKRMKDEKSGLPVDDELSHRIKEKAAARAFYFSIYLWTFILLFMHDTSFGMHVPVGFGLIGMAVMFMLFWFYYTKTGVSDENTD